MKILVPVKRVIDPYVRIRIKDDQTDVVTEHVKMSMNPFDEIAVEEAVRIKEAQGDVQITAITIGGEASQETLRHAMALGVDEAIHIRSDESLLPLSIAKVLAHQCKQIEADLILLGKQAIDDDNNQVAQMLAGLLDWPQACFASEINISSDHIKVVREVDGGLETLQLNMPAVISTDLRLNVPRYAALPNIMKAKSKPINEQSLDSLGLNLTKQQTITKVTAPAERAQGIIVSDVDELISILKDKEQVIG